MTKLQQVVLLIANDGERAIRDVIEPLSVTIPAQVELLDASIVHRHPAALEVAIRSDGHPRSGTNVKFEFPLLNKREFFAVKLLLSGRLELDKLSFCILSDDLPRTIQITRIRPSALMEPSHKDDWIPAVIALIPLLVTAWVLYAAKLLHGVDPSLFPYPWAPFVVSARSLFLVIAGALIAIVFGVLGLLLLLVAAFGGEFPPHKKLRFPIPKGLQEAVFPYGIFPLEAEIVERGSKQTSNDETKKKHP